MKQKLCKLIGGHFWGIVSYSQLLPPVWGTKEDRHKFYEDLANRKCSFCGTTPSKNNN